MHQQDEFKKQLDEMLQAGIIAEVHEATPWINSFVIVESVKDGKRKLQICLDPKALNKAIMREPYSHAQLMMCTTYLLMPNISQLLTLRNHFGNFPLIKKVAT